MGTGRTVYINGAQITDLMDIIISKNYIENGVRYYSFADTSVIDSWYSYLLVKDLDCFYDMGIDFFSLRSGLAIASSDAVSDTFKRFAEIEDSLSEFEVEDKEDYLGYRYSHKVYSEKVYRVMATEEHMHKVYEKCTKNGPKADEAYRAINRLMEEGIAYNAFCSAFSYPARERTFESQ